MPPKKVKKKSAKKKKAATPELSLDDKYKQTLFEIDSLKDHLALYSDISLRSQENASQMRTKVVACEEEISLEKLNKHDLIAELTRQYKVMHSEMTAQVDSLQRHANNLENKLAVTQQELNLEKREKEQMLIEKNDKITQLELKIDHLESAFENIIHDTFDEMQEQVEVAQNRWRVEASQIEENHKKLLVEYGLDPLLL